MKPYMTGIERHLATWHAHVLLDCMHVDEDGDEPWVSERGRVFKFSDGGIKRQFINLRGIWEIDAKIKAWLEEANIPFIIRLNSTVRPYEWSLCFQDVGHAAMFKLRWGGVEY